MIRYLENYEKQNIRPLYEQCFNDSREFTDYYFNKRISNNYVAVNEKEGQILSAMHMIPKNAIVGKLKTRLMYIYGVATDLLHRQQGNMKEMFEFVLKDMFNDMEAFTYLIPEGIVNADIYRKLGFEYVMDKGEEKPIGQRKRPTHSLLIRKAENSDMIRLAIFAQSSTERKYKVTLSKDIDYFRKLKELIDIEGGQIDIYVENKVIVGYRVIIDNEIFEEVLDGSISTMSWLETEGKPYAMARIINVRKTLRLLDFQGFGKKIIKISDSVIEANDGCFELTYEKGHVKLKKIDENKLNNPPEIDITIGQLTAHVFGYKSIDGLPMVCSKDCFFINDYV